jgi:hypothetical protein
VPHDVLERGDPSTTHRRAVLTDGPARVILGVFEEVGRCARLPREAAARRSCAGTKCRLDFCA